MGIGVRAPYIDSAEKNWVEELLKDDVEIGRVNENLGPIGYRTLMTWKIKEKQGYSDLTEKLKNKSKKIVEHVSQLAALLKAGDIHYGFLYKSTCIKYDIRYITLDEKINLGSADIDYSDVEVSFKTPDKKRTINIKGSPITYSLTIPVNAPNPEHAKRFIKYLLTTKKNLLEFYGMKNFKPKPKFYGKKEEYKMFSDFTEYGVE